MLIELERWEINTILNALAEQPYKDVSGVIHRITEQVKQEDHH